MNHMKRAAILIIFLFAGAAVNLAQQQRAVVTDRTAEKMLLGRHLLSLQWISWDHFGYAVVTKKMAFIQSKVSRKAAAIPIT